MATSHTRSHSHSVSPDPRESLAEAQHSPRLDNTPPLFPGAPITQHQPPQSQPRQSPPLRVDDLLSHTIDDDDDDDAERRSAAYILTAARNSPPTNPTALLTSPPSSKRRRLSASSPPMQRTESPDQEQEPQRRKKPQFTGHRRDITSASLTPLEAPTRPRQYYSQSATRRKDAPVPVNLPAPHQVQHVHPAYAQQYQPYVPYYESQPNDPRTHMREVSHSDVSSEEGDHHTPRNNGAGSSRQGQGAAADSGGSAADPLEIKRRQNTVAARRSRQRKLDYVRSLENSVQALTAERDDLRVTVGKLEYKIEVYKEVIARGNGTAPPL